MVLALCAIGGEVVSANSPPLVSNITASQWTDGSRLVDVYCDLSDADGVAFAAIQGLYGVVQEKRAEFEAACAEKDAEMQQLHEQNGRLETHLGASEEIAHRLTEQREEGGR
jgi:hypothetical protein